MGTKNKKNLVIDARQFAVGAIVGSARMVVGAGDPTFQSHIISHTDQAGFDTKRHFDTKRFEMKRKTKWQ